MRAMDHIRLKFGQVVFLVVCEDAAWCERRMKFADIVVFRGQAPAVQLAILSLTQATILTTGPLGCRQFVNNAHTQLLSDLQEFVDVTMKCKELPGLTMAVVKGNETWAKGFGVADKETGRPVTTSTLFGIGSITKSFTTAILAMLLNDTGRYTWETPVKDILGEDFQLGRQVVSHGGSLFAYRSNLAFLPDDDVGVFVSSTGPARYLSSQQLFYYITDLLLDLDPWLNTSTVCTFPAPWNRDDQRSSPSGPSPVPDGKYQELQMHDGC
nr:hypothetical protein BaRGS_005115 [Batillaria attramentaria]